jgi:hypothetical protein
MCSGFKLRETKITSQNHDATSFHEIFVRWHNTTRTVKEDANIKKVLIEMSAKRKIELHRQHPKSADRNVRQNHPNPERRRHLCQTLLFLYPTQKE